jgi:hypothetical protein
MKPTIKTNKQTNQICGANLDLIGVSFFFTLVCLAPSREVMRVLDDLFVYNWGGMNCALLLVGHEKAMSRMLGKYFLFLQFYNYCNPNLESRIYS